MKLTKLLENYHELIKAKQTVLLLVTAVFSYLISAVPDNLFSRMDFFHLIFALFFAVSGTTMLNMYIDHDIDAIMERTKCRPIPSGRVSLRFVLINGIIFTGIGFAAGFTGLDLLTGFIIFLGFFFDFVIYSIWLKRRTKYSIIFGGISGGLPALAGRVAVVGKVDLIGIMFLLFILTWIPIHILTLALIPENLEGYKQAGVPMWPVVTSKEETIKIITGSALVNTVVIFITGLVLHIDLIVLAIIGLCCLFLIFFSVKNLIKPSHELTFTIFKFASMFMLFGFILLYIGVVI
ncbi:MAG: protoheme IX farnesyltransferase [Promethearchaeota archaeon]